MTRIENPKKLERLAFLGMNNGGEMVFLDPEGPNWTGLNPSVALLLSLCDGKHTIGELASFFSVQGSKADHEEHLRKMLEGLLEIGFLAEESSTEYNRTDERILPLSAVSLYLTRACNLSCRYCFFNAGQPMKDEMTTNEVRTVLEDLAQFNVRTVFLMGGEPLFRHDVFEIAHYGKTLGLNMNLVTNGTLIDSSRALEVSRTFDTIQISLDGLESDHDFVRGRGSFRATVKGMNALLASGAEFSVSCIVSRRNLNKLDEWVAFLADTGIKNAHFTHLQSCGRACSAKEMGITKAEFLAELFGVWTRWNERIAIRQIETLLNPPMFQPKTSCGAGNGMVEIDPAGRVYPCYQFMEFDQPIGDLRRQSIAEIYHSSALQSVRSFTVDADEHCGKCQYKFLCGGGCLAKREEELQAYCSTMKALYHWILTETRDGKVNGSGFSSAFDAVIF